MFLIGDWQLAIGDWLLARERKEIFLYFLPLPIAKISRAQLAPTEEKYGELNNPGEIGGWKDGGSEIARKSLLYPKVMPLG